MNRSAMIDRLHQQAHHAWDVVIIGGGATGLGCAADAITRGYSTLLIEQSDFAKSTSSKSTKLIHGGVRYLAQGNVRLVKEALRERGHLLHNAPHLVHNLSLVIPAYKALEQPWYFAGLTVYDLLAGKRTFGRSRWLNVKNTLSTLSGIRHNGLRGGILYHDGQFDDARLAITLAATAADHGAVMLNYMKAAAFQKNKAGKLQRLELEDQLSGEKFEVAARCFINAAGVFADETAQRADAHPDFRLRPSQGVHIMVDGRFLPGANGLMIPKTTDGRVLFALPWHDKVIIGTTDQPVPDKSLEPVASEEEINFILQNAARYLQIPIQREDILSRFAGLRPLAASVNASAATKEISRGHRVSISPSGLVSVIGGKWTTYRRMAQDTLDAAIGAGQLPAAPCKTEHLRLHGYTPQLTGDHVLDVYGSHSSELIQLRHKHAELERKIHPRLPYTYAELHYALEHEMAMTPEDLLLRRTRCLLLDARATQEIAEEVTRWMAAKTGKDQAWTNAQVNTLHTLIRNYRIDG